ncbi:group 1 truncated hemoglobin [Flavobacterium sp. 123]|jgi:hemoglobin|uniref:group I truncated hemoglobin n=1 Tax=Flavobacterium sp. 123 TaxID=2135627 RepID=UPI000EB106D6|nr:group 1 truncated hemoglobin [Flavobacterium sp. 123]RKS99195.1 hemoglobin [Flavobacterium sp. 123]
MSTTDQHNSLYDRLGGTNGISSIVDNVFEAHMTNPVVKARFLPLKEDPAHFAEVRQNVIDFFVTGSGGPEVYKGKDMTAAHKGMNISEAEYMNAIDDILFGLEKNNIDEQSKNDVLAILYSLKDHMIRV